MRIAALTALLGALYFLQAVSAATSAESGETESLRFAYDGHTHMLMVVRQAVCYIFVLTDAEQTQVHTDAGLRQLELQLFTRLRDPNLVLTTVPKNSLHTNILRECGHGILNYHIIQ